MVDQNHILQKTTIHKTLPFLKPVKNYLPSWFPKNFRAETVPEPEN